MAAWVFALCPALAAAQTHVLKKPETVVRALGVYEWTGDPVKPTASRFVPVSIFINGELEDAGVYLSRPVPFVLATGNIFELDRAGVPEGTLDIEFARKLTATTPDSDSVGWLGFGPVKLTPKEAPAAAKKSGPLPKVQVSGGKGPHFNNKPDAADDTKPEPVDRSGAAGRGTTVSATGGDPKDAGNGEDSKDDVERPTLRKRTPEQQKAAAKKRDEAAVKGGGTALNDDPDRPTLHRGKAAGGPEEDGYPMLMGEPRGMQQRVAVSDAKNRAEHDFARSWESDAERLQVLGAMQTLARQRLAAYKGAELPVSVAVTQAAAAGKSVAVILSENAADGGMLPPADATAPPVLRRNDDSAAHSSPVTPPAPAAKAPPATAAAKPANPAARRTAARAAGHPATAASAALPLVDETLHGYTLSYGGAPTFVYTAASPNAAGIVRLVSIVAQQEAGNNLHVAFSTVTDDRHLDRTPQARLVDAVDAEASNRASLLFELRGQSTRQFALYRVIGAQAEQTFATGTTP